MKIFHSNKPLPLKFDGLKGADRALGIWDVQVTPHSRLRMKLLLFLDNKDLVHFWKKGLNIHCLCRRTCGVVSNMNWIRDYRAGPLKGQTIRVVDPRYFAVMGLVLGNLNMEVITHECGHAAFAYELRVGKRHKWPGSKTNQEEHICYPLGRIAQFVYDAVSDAGFLAMQEEMIKKKGKA